MQSAEASDDPDDYVKIKQGVVQQIGVETLPVERTTVFATSAPSARSRSARTSSLWSTCASLAGSRSCTSTAPATRSRRARCCSTSTRPSWWPRRRSTLLARRSQGPDAPLTKSARRRLELWNLAERDILAVAKAGASSRTVPIRAPQSGFILHKSLVEGARVTAGKASTASATSSAIWVARRGLRARAPWVSARSAGPASSSPTSPARSSTQDAYIYPTPPTSAAAPSACALEFDNPGVPPQAGHVRHRAHPVSRLDDVIAVPNLRHPALGAPASSCRRPRQGRFEPREVRTGLQGDHRMTEVVDGLEQGELVLTSGQFLLDSESQLQEALAKILAGAEGALDEPEPAGSYICPMHSEVVSDEPGAAPSAACSSRRWRRRRAGTGPRVV